MYSPLALARGEGIWPMIAWLAEPPKEAWRDLEHSPTFMCRLSCPFNRENGNGE